MSSKPVALCVFAVACSGARGPESVGTVPLPAFGVSSQYAVEQTAPPWSLTASDGSGLVLTRVDARAVFEGPLAFTELHLYFHNPEDRVREGTFAITLPAHAAVSRFAMENNGQWMEAEVVEKQLARRAYEDFLHRKQDPALLEKADGNQFTARVFPIPAKGDKHLVLSFSQELPGERYVLPLRGLPKVDRVDVRLATLGADGHKTEQVLAQKQWLPDRDFVSSAPGAAAAIGAGSLVAVQVPVSAAGAVATTLDVPATVTILVDTSASRTLGFAKSIDKLDQLIRALAKRHGGELALQVIAYDQETRPIFAGRAADWSQSHKAALLERGPAGASDLGQALAYLQSHAPHARLVVLGDAVITAGAKPEALAASVKQLAGVERVDVVLAGGIRDSALASQLVRAGKRAGAVLDLDAGVDDVAAGLGERVLTNVAIAVKGASWVYPRTIASARPSDRVMVYARMTAAKPKLELAVDRHWQSFGIVPAAPALVQRAMAAAEIEELEGKLVTASPQAAPGLRADIAKRSVAARVISSQTSMLVLESDADYARYGIDRTSLADILEVGPDGAIVQRHRTQTAVIATSPPVTKPKADQKPRNAPAKTADKDVDGRADFDGADDEEADDDGKERKKLAVDRAPPEPEPIEAPKTEPPPPPPPPPSRSESLRVAGDVHMRPPVTESTMAVSDSREAWPPKDAPAALTGELAAIDRAIRKHDTNAALRTAQQWHEREPGNVLAWIGLGEALEARQDYAAAARAYGSIIDLFPGRADLRRFAGERLERLEASRSLAIDTYQRAVADRPDHMTGHRLLAYALLRAGKHAEAFAAIVAGLEQRYPDGRFRGGERVLREDAGLIGAAYAAVAPNKRAEIEARLAKLDAKLATSPSTRFVLYWETDANDVDFHIQDARGGHAFYGAKQLRSGGELFDDVTTGYGPECFAIKGTPKAGPYKLSISYYAQGPMGYGMGLLQIVKHDGKGKLAFEDRPYIIMNDHAYVDLGTF
ncbi:MAG TPA: VIT domain-containing protein [Kofleriaceae bacterium]|nr:VIT domain-containing protein [Kofleriaceae bacterium]